MEGTVAMYKIHQPFILPSNMRQYSILLLWNRNNKNSNNTALLLFYRGTHLVFSTELIVILCFWNCPQQRLLLITIQIILLFPSHLASVLTLQNKDYIYQHPLRRSRACMRVIANGNSNEMLCMWPPRHGLQRRRQDYRKSPMLGSLGWMASTQVSHPETYSRLSVLSQISAHTWRFRCNESRIES